MKVAQEIDVDNVTIIINPQNKLEAKIPTTSNEVAIEEVPNETSVNAVVTLDGVHRRIVKLGKVNGTDWLVFQLEQPKPFISKEISIEFYDDVVSSVSGYEFTHEGKIRVTTTDGSPFTPNGDSGYDSYSDSYLKAWFRGNTIQSEETYPLINFNNMTYSVSAFYSEEQTSSTLESLSLYNETTFMVEHDDATYDYHITNISMQSPN